MLIDKIKVFKMWLVKARSCGIIFPAVVVAFFIVINSLRFVALDKVPYGAHVDEMSSSLVIDCLATEGHDFRGVRYPLFSELYFGTPKPPVYIYPGILWGKIFGFSVASLRAYTAFFFIIALVGLFMLARLFWGTCFALWVLFFSCISPWVWFCSRLAYESPFSLAFFIWGLFFFFRDARSVNMAIAGALISGAFYAYPPFRLQVPLVLAVLIYYRWYRGGLSLRAMTIFFSALIIFSFPIMAGILNGQLQARFNDISIFSERTGSLTAQVSLFLSNYLKHFSFEFLFLTGGSGHPHTSAHNGVLHWGDAVGLIFGVFLLVRWGWRRVLKLDQNIDVNGVFVVFLVVNIVLGVIPSALTKTLEQGNVLRTIGVWPFVMMLTAYCVWKVTEQWRILVPIVMGIVILFAAVFLRYYFKDYPQESKGLFSFWSMEQAKAARTESDWVMFLLRHRTQDLQACYYLMQYKGESCSSSKQKWDSLNEFLRLKGIQ